MNTIYRIVWNAATGKWVVASELAKGRKKKVGGKLLAAALALALVSPMAAAAAESCALENGQKGTVNASGMCVQDDSTSPIPTTPRVSLGGGTDNGIANSLAIGSGITHSAGAIAIGSGNGNPSATGNDSMALGTQATTTQAQSIAIGVQSQSNGVNAIALGTQAVASSSNAIAIGGAAAVGAGSIAIGSGAATADINSVAIGQNAHSNFASGTAIGSGALTRLQ
ncbi:MAG: ESPR-type extended signal peptide-containing protein [Rhodanobacter sp.]